jgi:hypothetical protein
MNNKDKEAFEKWRLEYISTHTGYFKMIGTDDLAQVVWQSACEYMRNKSNPLDALSLYEKLETERAENKALRKIIHDLVITGMDSDIAERLEEIDEE